MERFTNEKLAAVIEGPVFSTDYIQVFAESINDKNGIRKGFSNGLELFFSNKEALFH